MVDTTEIWASIFEIVGVLRNFVELDVRRKQMELHVENYKIIDSFLSNVSKNRSESKKQND